MGLTAWDYSSLIAKLFWYFGVIAAVGGVFSIGLLADHGRSGLRWSLQFSLAGALMGFHGVIFYFLLQVGAGSGAGISGMFDWNMVRFYLGLNVGETSLLRMAVLLLLGVIQLVGLWYVGQLTRPPRLLLLHWFVRINAIALVILLLSFQATGHVAPLSLISRIAVVLHVLCVALWLGSLLPLLRSTVRFDVSQAQDILQRFSRRATAMVAILLLAALWLTTRLLTSPADLVSSAYGLSLSLKILLVVALMGLAALNRWRLVPSLAEPSGVVHLRRSILLEMGVGLAILLVTVFLSTVIGPPSHG